MERNLSRRNALRVGAVGAAATFTGCSSVPGLTAPEISQSPQKESQPHRTIFEFTQDGEVQLGIQLNYEPPNETGVYQTPLGIQIWHHHEELHIEAFELEFRAAAMDHMDIFWKAPNSDWPDTDFELKDDGWTTLSVPDMGEYGQSTFIEDFYIRYYPEEESNNPPKVLFRAEFELAEDGWVGGSATARINDTFEMPVQ